LTRTLIFLVLVCLRNVIVYSYPETYTYDAVISLENAHIARNLRKKMWQADGAHYLELARRGYRHAPFDINNNHSQAFAYFPLHPLLLWLLSHVVKDDILWGAALCNLFFFLALVLLYKLTL